jgi:hypothetical protein
MDCQLNACQGLNVGRRPWERLVILRAQAQARVESVESRKREGVPSLPSGDGSRSAAAALQPVCCADG